MKGELKINNNFYKKDIGKTGEDKASDFLVKDGYTILARNFRTNSGEIDIIASKKKEYVFVEVKTRTSRKYGMPVDAIDANKKKHIVNASKYYIYKNKLQNKFIRYDIVEVYLNKNNYLINHIKNVFF